MTPEAKRLRAALDGRIIIRQQQVELEPETGERPPTPRAE